MFELDATSPDSFKDCPVQQQLIFDRQLRFAGEQPVHFVQLDSKLFILGEYYFLQFSLRSKRGPKYLASSAWGIFKPFKVTGVCHRFCPINSDSPFL